MTMHLFLWRCEDARRKDPQAITILIKFFLLLVVRHLFLLADIVTSSTALVPSSDALVTSSDCCRPLNPRSAKSNADRCPMPIRVAGVVRLRKGT